MDLVPNNAQTLNGKKRKKKDGILSYFTVPATIVGCKTMTTHVS